ncbi:YidC/Oxa1 family membrane protein insertase [Alkalibacter saccharofermentans]|jgi:YidC/Oxa1 family membrane protein insertase|uniref:Protein translocase subunit yidC n=1 Tax=Alkalibacter saccharofermentans DSM 14828 TaxID=1120975 RepID=A0A1M4T5U4_9FIRM|nr:YidC/Oxa1 family membrane protein insertase [Alkalibacter saccharofermentans]SHE39882.1 protein translocase subunit yidC [Alkalibacter saccharofermentans DSM 14828]
MSFLYGLFGSVLHLIYTFVQDYGISIVVFAVFAKLLMLPITLKQNKSMQQMNKLQPEIQALQKKHGNNKAKLNEEMMKIYQKHNYNPMGGCLPMLIQFPIIIGLFGVMREPVPYVFSAEVFATIDKSFLWLADLSAYDPLRVIPIVAAATTYLSMSNLAQPQAGGNNQAQAMTQSMKIISPLMIGFVSWGLPSGLGLYWIINNLLTYVQQLIMQKGKAPKEGEK